MDYDKIGENIRKYRKNRGMSQEQLAEKAGISVTHMSHIESGNTKLSLPVLIDFSKIFGVSIDELVFDRKYTEKNMAVEEILLILNQCSNEEVMVLTDIIRSAKYAMDKYLK